MAYSSDSIPTQNITVPYSPPTLPAISVDAKYISSPSVPPRNTVLVTGGCGYIGSHIVLELISQDYHVVIADDLSNASTRPISEINHLFASDQKITFYRASVTDESSIDSIFTSHPNIIAVIHLAARKIVTESVLIPLDYYHVNVSGTLSLLRVMTKHNVKTLVFSSSAAVYGELEPAGSSPLLIPEDECSSSSSAPTSTTSSLFGSDNEVDTDHHFHNVIAHELEDVIDTCPFHGRNRSFRSMKRPRSLNSNQAPSPSVNENLERKVCRSNGTFAPAPEYVNILIPSANVTNPVITNEDKKGQNQPFSFGTIASTQHLRTRPRHSPRIRNGIRRIGNGARSVMERDGTNPANPYGRSKAMAERILRDLSASDPTWSITILRYFNPCGAHASGVLGDHPHGRPSNLMPYLAKVASGEYPGPLHIYGSTYPTRDGTAIRDYVHVADLACAHTLALRRIFELMVPGRGIGCHIYNLGTGSGTTVKEMVMAMELVSGHTVPIVLAQPRPGDVACVVANADLAEKELGWVASRSIFDMCRDTWAWVNLKTVSSRHSDMSNEST